MDLVSEDNLSLVLQDVVRPVTESNPVGEDVTYDDDFQALKDAVDQLSSVNPEEVDVEALVATCRTLLGHKSKDLRVASYLALALPRTQGFRGVLEGLLAQKLLVERYWEEMYPPLGRMRARRNALQLVAERVGSWVEASHPVAGDRALLEASVEVVKGLQAFTMEAMGEEAPLLSGVRRQLEEAVRRAPKPAVVEEPPAPTGEDTGEAAVALVSEEAAPVPAGEETAEAAPAPAASETGEALLAALEAELPLVLQDVVRPVTESNPVGEDVTYDDDFQALKDAVDQLSSVNPEEVDVEALVATCRTLLGHKSKDLRVASYLALALPRTQGFRGVLEGLLAQKLLVERYWEEMYPPLGRMRARQNALQLVAERVGSWVEASHPVAGDRALLEASVEVVKGLQAFTMEAMGEEAPLLSGVRRQLEEAVRRVPKPVEKAPAPASAPAPAPASAASATAPAAAPASAPAGELKTTSDAFSQILKVAAFLREENPASPVPYRLARALRWDVLKAEPPDQKGKTTLSEKQPERLVVRMNHLVGNKDWATLLKEAEASFLDLPCHFLLDLQRYIVQAMEALGADYQRAREAVLYDTALLVDRLPRLPELAFANGQPFADPATRMWLEETVAGVLASDAGGNGQVDDDALASQYKEARQRLAEGNLPGALEVLQKGSGQDSSPRSRFQRRFYTAQLCMQGGQPDLACPILEELGSEVEQFALHVWEPGLALKVWTDLYRCYGLLRGDGPDREGLATRAQRVLGKISQIDVTKALKLSGT